MFSVNPTLAHVGSGRRFSAVLLGVLTLTALSAAPSLSAATPQQKHLAAKANNHSEQKGKFRGTLLSLSHDEGNILLNLSGGVTMTLPQNVVTVFDERTHKAVRSTVSQLASNMHVVVKTHIDKAGHVTEAKIRITN